jgi:hypothetical protein
MNQDNEYEIRMQGGGQKEPERKKDMPAHDPEPLTESEPPPDQIEPDRGWDRK